MTRAEATAKIDALLDEQWWRLVESLQRRVECGELDECAAVEAVSAAGEQQAEVRRDLLNRLDGSARDLRDEA